MTRWLLTLVVAFGGGRALAIGPVVPPVIVVPAAPQENPDAKPTAKPDDPAVLAEKITLSAKAVGEKLAEQDTSPATRDEQTELKTNLDKLIDLLENQANQSGNPPPMSGGGGSPPPPGGSPPKPMGGGGGGGSKPMPMGGKRSGSGRKPMGGSPMPESGQPDRQAGNSPMPGSPMPGSPMPMGGSPMPMPGDGTKANAGGNAPGRGGKATASLPLAETLAKDLWGHLPEQPRQRMMQFFREGYTSRYKDLLPDYFSTLTEKEKKGTK